MSFDNLISSQFSDAAKQCEVGLYVVKRTAAYLKKVTDKLNSFAHDIKKVTSHEEGKMDVMKEDQMFRHLAASVEVQDIVSKMGERYEEFGVKTYEEVVKPLEQFYKQAEDKRKKLVNAEDKLASRIQNMRKAVLKERSNCKKMFEECLKLKANKEKEDQRGDPKRIEKAATNLHKGKIKGQKLFDKFEQLRNESFATLNAYYDTDMPALLKQLNMLEMDRLTNLKLYLHHFSQLQLACVAEIPASETFAKMVESLNAEEEIAQCVKMLKMNASGEQARDPLVCDIPCDSKVILSDDWFNGGDPNNPVNPTAASTGQGSSSSGASPPMGQPPSASSASSSGNKLLVTALYDYEMQQEGDLSFKAGQTIHVISTGKGQIDPANEGWWEGVIEGTSKQGRFPSNYTQVLQSSSAPAPPTETKVAENVPSAPPVAQETASSGPTAVALYDYVYEPCGDPGIDGLGYIAFSAGDVIQVEQQEDEWWYGRNAQGEAGYFPANCVQMQ